MAFINYVTALLFVIQIVKFTCFYTSSLFSQKARKGFITMDDEVARNGIKNDLTTRDVYLETRFLKLSSSGHDLTPMTDDEISEWKETNDYSNVTNENYLGFQEKGLYVSNIGGLPLFTSGYRLDNKCNSSYLYFTSPCDEEHVIINRETMAVKCARSRYKIGILELDYNTSIYRIESKSLRFINLAEKLPIESQPENVWGTEGQYIAWNS